VARSSFLLDLLVENARYEGEQPQRILPYTGGVVHACRRQPMLKGEWIPGAPVCFISKWSALRHKGNEAVFRFQKILRKKIL
jgi:hypothetical protein